MPHEDLPEDLEKLHERHENKIKKGLRVTPMMLLVLMFAISIGAGIWIGSNFTIKIKGGCDIPIQDQIKIVEEEHNITGINERVFCTSSGCFKEAMGWTTDQAIDQFPIEETI